MSWAISPVFMKLVKVLEGVHLTIWYVPAPVYEHHGLVKSQLLKLRVIKTIWPDGCHEDGWMVAGLTSTGECSYMLLHLYRWVELDTHV